MSQCGCAPKGKKGQHSKSNLLDTMDSTMRNSSNFFSPTVKNSKSGGQLFHLSKSDLDKAELTVKKSRVREAKMIMGLLKNESRRAEQVQKQDDQY